jgi:hypothetical protein
MGEIENMMSYASEMVQDYAKTIKLVSVPYLRSGRSEAIHWIRTVSLYTTLLMLFTDVRSIFLSRICPCETIMKKLIPRFKFLTSFSRISQKYLISNLMLIFSS